MKLFLRGRKHHPLLYEGERQCSAFLQYLASNCKVSTGGDLLTAQFATYAKHHDLPRRMQRACARLEHEASEQPDLLRNPERWFSMFFHDPELFGEPNPEELPKGSTPAAGSADASVGEAGGCAGCNASEDDQGQRTLLLVWQPAMRWMSVGEEGVRPLRFGIGTEVHCNFGTGVWRRGWILAQWLRSNGMPSGQCAAYAFQLDDGTVGYAPLDDDECIMRAPPSADYQSRMTAYGVASKEEVRAAATSDGVIWLDVRTAEERSDAPLGNGLSVTTIHCAVTLTDGGTAALEANAAQILGDKHHAVLCFCALGRRAAKACEALANLGYSRALNAGGHADVNVLATIVHHARAQPLEVQAKAAEVVDVQASASAAAVEDAPAAAPPSALETPRVASKEPPSHTGSSSAPEGHAVTTSRAEQGRSEGVGSSLDGKSAPQAAAGPTQSASAATAAAPSPENELTWERLKRQYRSRTPVLVRVLLAIERLLTAKFPEKPFEYLAPALLYATPVRACTMVHNIPAQCQEKYDRGEMNVWRRLKHAEGMSELEVKRAWPGAVDAIRRPALTRNQTERRKEMKRVMSTLRELIERGLPIDAAPQGPSLALIVSGMGRTHINLLNKLFFSDANMQQLNTLDGALPIEVAAAMGHTEVVMRLWGMGCGVGRALHCALHESQFETAERLIAKVADGGCGVPVDLRWRGISPLEWAILTKNRAVAASLIRDHSALLDRPLTESLCRRCDLATGSTIAHLCAKMGLEKVLESVLERNPALKDARDDERKVPKEVADPALFKVFDQDSMRCWRVLEDTLLHPDWDRTAPGALEGLKTGLSQAIDMGGDPAAHNAVGWTCLMAVALAAELEAVREMLKRIRCVRNPLQHAARRAASRGADESDALTGEEQRAERVIYATSPSGLTALLWAHWVAWISEQPDSEQGQEPDARRHPSSDADVARRANGIVAEFAAHGATLREGDKAALQRLKDAYVHGDAEERSLMRFDPSQLKVMGVSQNGGASEPSSAAERRQQELSTRKVMELRHYVKPDYKPATTLETFLLSFRRDGFRFKDGPKRGKPGAPLYAPEFGHSMRSLIVSCKLFVQDRVASGICAPAKPKHIFALHLYTLDTSVFRDMNTSMRELDVAGCEAWRPFIWYCCQALDALNVCSAVAFRGIKLWQPAVRGPDGVGTVRTFLDGTLFGKREDDASKYHPGNVICWPSFTSTTTDFSIASEYGCKNLATSEASVIFKVYTQRVRPIEAFSYYPFERELLYPPNMRFRVTGLWEPTKFNIRQGTPQPSGDFQISTDQLLQGKLSLDEARTRQKVLITLAEEVPEAEAEAEVEYLEDEGSPEAMRGVSSQPHRMRTEPASTDDWASCGGTCAEGEDGEDGEDAEQPHRVPSSSGSACSPDVPSPLPPAVVRGQNSAEPTTLRAQVRALIDDAGDDVQALQAAVDAARAKLMAAMAKESDHATPGGGCRG